MEDHSDTPFNPIKENQHDSKCDNGVQRTGGRDLSSNVKKKRKKYRLGVTVINLQNMEEGRKKVQSTSTCVGRTSKSLHASRETRGGGV